MGKCLKLDVKLTVGELKQILNQPDVKDNWLVYIDLAEQLYNLIIANPRQPEEGGDCWKSPIDIVGPVV